MLWLRGELRNPAINVKFYCDANFRTFGCQKLNALAARANFEIFHAKKMNFNCKFSHESLSYALNGTRFWICSPRRFEWTNFFRKMFKNKKNHFFHGVRFDETWDDIWQHNSSHSRCCCSYDRACDLHTFDQARINPASCSLLNCDWHSFKLPKNCDSCDLF